MTVRIGVLHPGEMGVSVAQAIVDSGHQACWVSAGRSAQTRARGAPFASHDTLAGLLEQVDAVISVCPPHAAMQLAREVRACGFEGIYVDANAVAPDTAQAISEAVGAGYVDGGIIGPPAHKPGTTRIYLSGERAAEVAPWFSGGKLGAVVLDGGLASASALKMAYAAYTKGSSALLLAVNALGQAYGVHDALVDEWELSQPGLGQRSQQTAAGTSRKAWRFVGEMQEIAQTFAAAGLTDEFHKGAAEIYQRMAGLKDQPPASLEQVLAQLLAQR